jgi:hypothetical protein
MWQFFYLPGSMISFRRASTGSMHPDPATSPTQLPLAHTLVRRFAIHTGFCGLCVIHPFNFVNRDEFHHALFAPIGNPATAHPAQFFLHLDN